MLLDIAYYKNFTVIYWQKNANRNEILERNAK